jgi:ABC-type nitrate/sulfonate/bicarbonate transport system ATPase subunit
MDEPLAHLDTALKLELLPTIGEAVEETGATLVYVTHDIEEARALSAEVIQMEAGRLVSDGQQESE